MYLITRDIKTFDQSSPITIRMRVVAHLAENLLLALNFSP